MNPAQMALDQFQPHVAWQPFVPSRASPWDEIKVAHLYRRSSFGAAWGRIQEGTKLAPEKLVERVMQGPPADKLREFEDAVSHLRDAVLAGNQPWEAKALWLYRMRYSPHPLRERMTLFWHNHFATSNAKVRSLKLMQQQNETLRRHALGHFDSLLTDMTFDPAMLIWLDSDSNRTGAPNENYAREVMELFSLGVGNYTEHDIQEAARALTGWKHDSGSAVFDSSQFDRSEKTVFGKTGRWTAGDLVRLCLEHEACSRFIVRKLFRELVSETAVPGDDFLEPLASGFRNRNYDIAWLVDTILRSNLFYSPAAIRQKVKSPCDFLIGAMLALEGRPSLALLVDGCDELGQSLFHPPSVKGWDGGQTWINSATMLRRQNLAFEITRGATGAMRPDPWRMLDERQREQISEGNWLAERADPARLPQAHGITGPRELAEFFLKLFYQSVDDRVLDTIVSQLEEERGGDTPQASSKSDGDANLARSAAHLAMTLPQYQLA